MKNIIFLIITTFLFGFHSENVQASHAAGAELRYECIGNDQYIITMIFYRDCFGIPPSNPMGIQVVSSCSNDTLIYLPQVGAVTQISPVCPTTTTTCNGGAYVGIEKHTYCDTISLPIHCSDWVFSHVESARNAAITTITGAGSDNLAVYCLINNTQNFCQKSPEFTSELTPFLYVGQQYCITPGAGYTSGDSLTYELITPRTGITAADTVTFLSGYSRTQPILSTPPCTFDTYTGDFCCTPTQSEVSILAELISQYRNGILIGQVERDFQINVMNPANHQVYLSGFNNTPIYTMDICEGQLFTSNIVSRDIDASNTTTITVNPFNTNGINFQTTGGHRDSLLIAWTPTQADVASSPNCFTVYVKDDNCPYFSFYQSTYCINVYAAGTHGCAPLAVYSLQENQITNVYPNPTENYVNIEYKTEHQLLSIELYDLIGQKVATEKGAYGNPFQYDINKYKAGVYFLRLHFDNGEQTVRVEKLAD